ncbi:MAG: flagellar biosynthesis protein FlhA [Gammaproteobacteria bacterium]|nr:flagellar biosynthesis protein FlhA [Gammaproteobacteria bacterium]
MEATSVATTNQPGAQRGIGAPIMILILLAMMVIPLPPLALDIFFSFSIALSLIVLLVGVYVLRPLDFAIFPAVLLVTTLFRLALNIASTRVVLLEGHTGTGAAGKVIESFGEFVIGGNYAVGLVVFAILVIINFVVVTKGAGRIAEVTARFTLDALPGKQMAIDADLNAGILTAEDARDRREEIRREADFYGSMDGASKFVRGDAIAGILILFINIIGGLTIGMVQHELDMSEAVRNYTLLTIGDGLVAQIPSLLISSSAALIVTRASGTQDMGKQAFGQLFGDPKIMFITAAILGAMGIIPGMPNFAFLSLAAAVGGAGYYLAYVKPKEVEEKETTETEEETPTEAKDLSWDDVRPVDRIGLEVGYRLIPLVDKNQNGELMGRIKGVRRKLSQELGFLIQPVHIRDNLDLTPDIYRISLNGVTAGEAEIHPDMFMAINPGQVYGTVEGVKTIDPAFGLEAVWVDAAHREQAQTLGYTVVDPSTVVATHLSQIIQRHAHQLLGHEEVQKMMDVLAQSAPKLVEDLVPKVLPLGTVLTVLQDLLEEKVPIRDMRTIAETLAAQAPKSQDPVMLTSAVRIALKQSIVQNINGMEAELSVMTLDPGMEQLLLQSIQGSENGDAGIEPGLAETLFQGLRNNVQQQEISGKPSILIISPILRTWLARMVKHSIPDLHVLSYNEVPDDKQIKVVATIGDALPSA